MKRITIDYILSLENTCYKREELEKMFRGRKWVTPETVCKEAKPGDALWLLLRKDFFTEKQLRLLICDFKEHLRYITNADKLVTVDEVIAGTRNIESVARTIAWFASVITQGVEREWQVKRILEELDRREK